MSLSILVLLGLLFLVVTYLATNGHLLDGIRNWILFFTTPDSQIEMSFTHYFQNWKLLFSNLNSIFLLLVGLVSAMLLLNQVSVREPSKISSESFFLLIISLSVLLLGLFPFQLQSQYLVNYSVLLIVLFADLFEVVTKNQKVIVGVVLFIGLLSFLFRNQSLSQYHLYDLHSANKISQLVLNFLPADTISRILIVIDMPHIDYLSTWNSGAIWFGLEQLSGRPLTRLVSLDTSETSFVPRHLDKNTVVLCIHNPYDPNQITKLPFCVESIKKKWPSNVAKSLGFVQSDEVTYQVFQLVDPICYLEL